MWINRAEPPISCNSNHEIILHLQVPNARRWDGLHRVRGRQPEDPLLWRQQPLWPTNPFLPQLSGDFTMPLCSHCNANVNLFRSHCSPSTWSPIPAQQSTPSSAHSANNRRSTWSVLFIYFNLFIQPLPLFLLNSPIKHLCCCFSRHKYDFRSFIFGFFLPVNWWILIVLKSNTIRTIHALSTKDITNLSLLPEMRISFPLKDKAVTFPLCSSKELCWTTCMYRVEIRKI